MRDYLTDFFEKFDYEKEDSDFLLKVYDMTVNDEEANNCLNEALAIYAETYKCDYGKIIALADKAAERLYLSEYTTEFLFFVCLTRQAAVYYEENGISDEIYYNSMLDLRYKLLECKMIKGIIGTFVAFWFDGFFALTRFTLGRLQFESDNFGLYYEKDGKRLLPESKIICVHIPRTGTPLDMESCKISFDKAKKFFEKEVGKNCAFVCKHSWLLYPENKHIFSEKSNIYRFMSLFDIVDSKIYRDNDDLWRLFDTDEKNYEKLPGDTSARRAYIAHLKNGGRTGWGTGVFFAE